MTYSINFSTNASQAIRDIERINRSIGDLGRLGQNIELNLNTASLNRTLDNTLRQLDNAVARMQRSLRGLSIGSPEFLNQATLLGRVEGSRQRGQMLADAPALRGQATAFDPGSSARQSRELQALQIEASQVAPNTDAWVQVQRQIATINTELKRAQQLAQNIQLREDLGAFSPGSLSQLETRLQLLNNIAKDITPNTVEWGNYQREISRINVELQQTKRNAQEIQLTEDLGALAPGSLAQLETRLQLLQQTAREIAPNTPEWENYQQRIAQANRQLDQTKKRAQDIRLRDDLGAFAPGSLAQLETRLAILKNSARQITPNTSEWRDFNSQIQRTERSIQKLNKKPLTGGQRAGAAGGAFLYGGGLGGGAGSALGGIGGGLIGGVPGAFTGAAIGQAADNLTGMTSAMVTEAATIQKLRMGLATASNDLLDYRDSLKQVQDISNNLLLPLEKVTQKFTQLKASTVALGFDAKTTGEIFQGTAAAVLQAGGSLDDVDGAMRAVVQVFSKGKLTAEEMRGQLGERLPGAVVEFAKSAGMSVQELDAAFQAGTTSLDDFVKFLREKKGDTQNFLKEMETSSTFAGARMEKAFENLRLVVGQSLQPMGAEMQDFATSTVKLLDKVIKKMIELKVIQPGPDFLAQQALEGTNGGVAGLEQRTLDAQEKARKAAQGGPSTFVANYISLLENDATLSVVLGREAKRQAEALAQVKKQLALTKKREVEDKKVVDDKRGQSFLDAIEKREEAIANAREKYEEDIANIRKNAIKQAETLERGYNDKRLQAEQEIARTRRQIATSQAEQALVRRELNASVTGEDPALIDQERKIGQIVNQFTEEKISLEEQAQKEQLDLARELEDFKRQNADAINQANERYAKAIGEIQKNYAKAVAKLIEDGSGSGAKKLAAAGKLIAAQIAQASAQNSFVASTGGGSIIANAGGYEVSGQQLTERQLLDAAQKSSPGTNTAAKAFVAATNQIQVAQKELSASFSGSRQLTASTSTGNVSVGDIYGNMEQASKKLGSTLQSGTQNKQALNSETLMQNVLQLLEEQTAEGRNRNIELDKETNLLNEQYVLIADGMLPTLAKEEAARSRLADIEANRVRNAMSVYIAQINASKQLDEATKKDRITAITKELEKQLIVIDAQGKKYQDLAQAQRDSLGLVEAATIKAETKVIGQGLGAGFINEAAAAYENQISKGVSPEIAANVAKATEQMTLAKIAADGLQGAANAVGDSFAQAFKGVVSGSMTAQQALAGMFQSIADSFLDMVAQMIAAWAKIAVAKGIASIIGMIIPGFGAAASPGGLEGVNMGAVNQYSAPLGYANGGIVSGGFRAFASGGIVTGPTLGLVGEGRYNEAVIPLPDGKSVPVDLGGMGGGGNQITSNIVVNVNSDGQSQSQQSGNGNAELGKKIEGAVKQVIVGELRPGGLLAGRR
jgi:tape measure domain-containing protein